MHNPQPLLTKNNHPQKPFNQPHPPPPRLHQQQTLCDNHNPRQEKRKKKSNHHQTQNKSAMKMKICVKMKIDDKPRHHQPCQTCSSLPNGHDLDLKFCLPIHLCQSRVLEWSSRTDIELIV